MGKAPNDKCSQCGKPIYWPPWDMREPFCCMGCLADYREGVKMKVDNTEKIRKLMAEADGFLARSGPEIQAMYVDEFADLTRSLVRRLRNELNREFHLLDSIAKAVDEWRSGRMDE